jgi:hypothetical protein
MPHSSIYLLRLSPIARQTVFEPLVVVLGVVDILLLTVVVLAFMEPSVALKRRHKGSLTIITRFQAEDQVCISTTLR